MGIPTGYVATVSGVEPNVVGVSATTVLGDQVLVRNLTQTPVVILDRRGRPFIRIRAAKSRSWHDARVVESGPPPAPAPGAAESAPRFVKNWRIPGRARGRSFAIRGFLGWVPPRQQADDDGTPWAIWVGGAAVLIALSAGAAYLLGRGRPA